MCSHSRVRVPLRAFFFSLNETSSLRQLFHNRSFRYSDVWEEMCLNDRFRMNWIPSLIRVLDEQPSYGHRVMWNPGR